MIDVRSVEPSDAQAWVEMRSALWPDQEFQWHAREVEQYFAGQLSMPVEVLIARDGDQSVVGFAELGIRPYAEGCESDRVAYLEGWYVVTDARRSGVGRALVEAAERWALAEGCTEFGSDTLIDNDVSTAAHLALGFDEVECIRCFRKSLRP